MKNAKIAVYSVEVETVQTENKGTVLIENSDQLLNYNRSEEIAMEKVRKLTASTVDGCGAVLNGVVPRAFMQMIKSIVDSGANVIITGSKFSEMATHYCERYGVLMLKVSSCHPVSVTRLLIQRLTHRFFRSSKSAGYVKPLVLLAWPSSARALRRSWAVAAASVQRRTAIRG